jgi:hypothetical protein
MFSVMNKEMKKILLLSMFVLLISSHAYAEYETTEGYDENTEIKIAGTVTQVVPRARGPVTIIIRTVNRDYMVITGPQWFIVQEGFNLKAGDILRVTGSKFIGRDGNLYIVARKIKDSSTGKVLRLRDSNLLPFWRGHHNIRGRGYDSQ